MTGPCEPVDRDLLAETVRLFGMAVEYKGQVFNPAEVMVHTDGVTDAHRLSLVWAVMNRWTRPDCAPTTDEATRLLGEIREALTVAPEQDLVSAASRAIEAMQPDLARTFPNPLTRERLGDITAAAGFANVPDRVTVTYERYECTCECITQDVRDPEEICAHPDCLFGKDPSCPVHGKQATLPITGKESAVLGTGQTLDEFADQFRREREGNWTPPDRPEVDDA